VREKQGIEPHAAKGNGRCTDASNSPRSKATSKTESARSREHYQKSRSEALQPCSVWISEKCLDRDVCRINRFDKTNLVQKVRTANASTKRFRELACSWDTFGAHLAFVSDDGVFVSGCGSDQPGICRIAGSSLFPQILGLCTKDIKFALHVSAVLFFDGKKKLTLLAEQESIEPSVALQLYKYLPHRFQVAVCGHFS
jgi:hypothetical protein